jgi:RND family efflux transporter MFP subunit
MKPTFVQLILILTMLLPGIGNTAGKSSSSLAVKVTVKPLISLLTHPTEDAPATVLSLSDSQLSSEVSGKIIEISVEVGDRVEKGAVIARLDPWLYRVQLQQAQGMLRELKASLALAQRERERLGKLRKKGQSTVAALDAKVSQVDRLAAQLTGQRSRVAESRTRLAKTTILAPFSGLISQRSGQIGGWVGPGTPLVRLVDLNRVELSADVASQHIGQLEKASGLVFVYLGSRYPVAIRSLLPMENSATQTREIRLTFAATTPPVGAAGRLTWTDSRAYLPPWVLVRRSGGLGIFMVKAGRAQFLPLPHAREGIPALLPDGVSGRVVIDGREALSHGSSLSIIPTTD